MLGIYKTVDGRIVQVDAMEPDTWINLTNPTADEINTVLENLKIIPEFIYAALDEEETSHIESEDGNTLILVDIPYPAKTDHDMVQYLTIPLGIIVAEKHIVTVCLKENDIITDFSSGKVKSVYTNMKTRFILQIMYKMATRFLQDLKQIDKMSNLIERRLHLSMRNQELIQLLDLEKSLVFFSTSIKADEATIEKIMRGRVIKMYEEDEELVEDVLIEIKQAIEMSNIYSNILSGTMDAFASIISNNLNIVMKVLTSITILMAIPQIFAALYGMNVNNIPVPNFWFVAILSVFVAAIVGLILYKKKLF
ncbi:MAG: magnesium transporter CorA family protein [Clostridia bacterium]|nr:magnesium transporter CorA family protein [Clostridia bacterium]